LRWEHFLFIVGSLLSFLPQASPKLAAWANLIFFLGSIPFTVAAYMQHFQAANAAFFSLDPAKPQPTTASMKLLGWRPRDIGWVSTFTQFLGTLAFNISTLGAIEIINPWYLQDAIVWLPDVLGSMLFLLSAYLAFVEANHAAWCWKPVNIAWQIVFVNLIGCIAFMVAACTDYVPLHGPTPWVAWLSNFQLLIGATCFLIGALLSIRESQAADCS